MIIHIVREGETIRKIIAHYEVSENDLLSENRHITDWYHLVPGMKIRIPLLNEETLEVLEETEPFIEDYYKEIDEKTNTSIDDLDTLDNKHDNILNNTKDDTLSIDNIEKELSQKELEESSFDDKNEENQKVIKEDRKNKGNTLKNNEIIFYKNGYIKKI